MPPTLLRADLGLWHSDHCDREWHIGFLLLQVKPCRGERLKLRACPQSLFELCDDRTILVPMLADYTVWYRAYPSHLAGLWHHRNDRERKVESQHLKRFLQSNWLFLAHHQLELWARRWDPWMVRSGCPTWKARAVRTGALNPCLLLAPMRNFDGTISDFSSHFPIAEGILDQNSTSPLYRKPINGWVDHLQFNGDWRSKNVCCSSLNPSYRWPTIWDLKFIIWIPFHVHLRFCWSDGATLHLLVCHLDGWISLKSLVALLLQHKFGRSLSHLGGQN